jgi:hypothetical protein
MIVLEQNINDSIDQLFINLLLIYKSKLLKYFNQFIIIIVYLLNI